MIFLNWNLTGKPLNAFITSANAIVTLPDGHSFKDALALVGKSGNTTNQRTNVFPLAKNVLAFSNVTPLLNGEKMDIIVRSEDPAKFVAAALSPADVIPVTVLPGAQKACRVIVPDDQLSLAIGKEGQNARLAARLTGYKIDIKPASQAAEFEQAQEPAAPEAASEAEEAE